MHDVILKGNHLLNISFK